jgi:exo-beta-1,3-glucanase (GH17 family)
MTTHAAASLHTKHPKKSLFNPATLLALGVAAAASFGVWDYANQPVAVPGFSGEVGGVAFSPFHRGESAETDTYPTTAEIREDLQKASNITGRIRTYSMGGTLADIPRLAADYPLQVTLGAWIDKKPAADEAQVKSLMWTV